MKKTSIDKSTPYRYLGIGMVNAPAKNQNEPKSSRIKSGGKDMRCAKGGK